MTQQVINIGSAPDDATGDPLRTSFDKTNENFTELYMKGANEGIWNYNQTTTDTSTSPVSGRFRTNSGNYHDATQIAIHAITIQGIDRTSTLRTLLVGDLVQCQDSTNPAAWCRYSLQSLPVDHGTWFQLNVTLQADSGVASGDNQEIVFVFTANSGGGGGGAYQPLDPTLTSLSDLVGAANTFPYFAAADTFALDVVTPFARGSILSAVNAGDARGKIGAAPVGAEYITSTADATLTAERVLTDTATVTWDRTTAGQIKATAVGGTSTTIADTPPGSPTNGSLWWESDTGTLWIYYNDGNTTQWVAVGGGGGGSPPLGVTDGSSAPVGYVGEEIIFRRDFSTRQALPNGVQFNIGSIALTAGEWALSYSAAVHAEANMTGANAAQFSLSTNSSGFDTGDGAIGGPLFVGLGCYSAGFYSGSIPAFTVRLTAPRNYYMIAFHNLGDATPVYATCFLRARRIR
jgi:hypothetical protein